MATDFDSLKKGFCYSAHGGGSYHGAINSNTKEAIEYWLDKGVRFLEINVTAAAAAAGKCVLLTHRLDPSEFLKYEIWDFPDYELTYEWFMGQKLFPVSTKGLTPLDLPSLIDYMRSHEDLIVMLDLWNQTKEDIDIIMSWVDSLLAVSEQMFNRLCIEVYSLKMLEQVRATGVNVKIMWGCMPGLSENMTAKALLQRDIKMVSLPFSYIKTNRSQFIDFRETDMLLFSYCETSLHSRELKKMGVHVNNVDVIFHGANILWEYPLYYYYKTKNKASHILIMYKRKGARGVLRLVREKMKLLFKNQ